MKTGTLLFFNGNWYYVRNQANCIKTTALINYVKTIALDVLTTVNEEMITFVEGPEVTPFNFYQEIGKDIGLFLPQGTAYPNRPKQLIGFGSYTIYVDAENIAHKITSNWIRTLLLSDGVKIHKPTNWQEAAWYARNTAADMRDFTIWFADNPPKTPKVKPPTTIEKEAIITLKTGMNKYLLFFSDNLANTYQIRERKTLEAIKAIYPNIKQVTYDNSYTQIINAHNTGQQIPSKYTQAQKLDAFNIYKFSDTYYFSDIQGELHIIKNPHYIVAQIENTINKKTINLEPTHVYKNIVSKLYTGSIFDLNDFLQKYAPNQTKAPELPVVMLPPPPRLPPKIF
jgi:hypothetical protein